MKTHLRTAKWSVFFTAAFGACVMLLMTMSGCTTEGTFTDPEPRCTMTAENAFWGVANAAVGFFAH